MLLQTKEIYDDPTPVSMPVLHVLFRLRLANTEGRGQSRFRNAHLSSSGLACRNYGVWDTSTHLVTLLQSHARQIGREGRFGRNSREDGIVEIEDEPDVLLNANCKVEIPTLENDDVGLLDATSVYAPVPEVFVHQCLEETRRLPRMPNRSPIFKWWGPSIPIEEAVIG